MSSSNTGPEPLLQGGIPVQSIVTGSLQEPTVHQLFSLSGRTAVVTGGARGLGMTLATALLEAGAHVYLLDVLPAPSEPEYKALSAKAQEAGLSVGYYKVDVTKIEQVDDVIQTIAKEAPAKIRPVIAAAGILQECEAIDYKQEDFRRIMDVNVLGVFNTAQAAAKIMLAHGEGGSITAIASMSGTIANRDLPAVAYNSSKSAVLQLCRSLSAEWAPKGIRVNSLSPGYIMTAMTAALLEVKPQQKVQWEDGSPQHRISEPWEYKGPAVFLASDASSFFTGMDLRADGGYCSW
ncbi:oxidoreductase [Punctularia strigosozonata HHB-11173 SS5]|uniref:oxidoreductase n=1 Tax=Punctularia strigosozonata (strain HHB-11173) TaxID=741275 RepID=UPI0004416C7D|nr:oxidoreductase [Punctularia strigosozonata HHB-11173 SS5]EIN13081.1 oxidoreductase [Punctularia strigosozonata HHB-11173 SS5]